MWINRWFGSQLALLSVICSTLAQSNLRSNLERTQDFQPTFTEAQFQPTLQSQLQQNQLQTGQFPDVKSLELQQQQFRESVAQAVRERARTAQLETTTQNIQNNFISPVPVQQFSSQEFPQSQQRRLQTNQQRRPAAIKQRLLQPTIQPEVQQPQFRQSQFPQQTIHPQSQQQIRGDVQPRISSDTQQNFQTQQPVISQVPRTQLQNDASRKTTDFSKAEEDLIRQQAENAHYSFDTTLVDSIMDNSQMRAETRNGLQVEGMYSYSDGYYKRTVFYEADHNGYRVIKEEVLPIGDGPQLDLEGRVDVDTNIGGVENHYTITAADIPFLQQQKEQ